MTENNHADAPQPERPAEFPLQSDQPASQTPRSDVPSEAAFSSPDQPPSADQPSYTQAAGYSDRLRGLLLVRAGSSLRWLPAAQLPHRAAPPVLAGIRPIRAAGDETAETPPDAHDFVAAVTAALVGAGVGAGTVALVDDNNSNGTVVSSLSTTTASAPVNAKTDGTVAGAAAKIQPSVVTISVSGSQESGTGTGVIIRSDGYILTNNHVVSVAGNGGSIQVLTDDGQQATAKIIGTDEPDDLAVIKVDGLSNLTAATFAKSSNLVVGQAVVAVGAPLGLSNTVTSGIVSNTARPGVPNQRAPRPGRRPGCWTWRT